MHLSNYETKPVVGFLTLNLNMNLISHIILKDYIFVHAKFSYKNTHLTFRKNSILLQLGTKHSELNWKKMHFTKNNLTFPSLALY